MAELPIPWASQSLGGRRNRVSSTDRLINLVPEQNSSLLANSSDATLLTLVSAPGARLISKIPDGTDINQLYSVGGRLFAWSRKGMYEVFVDRCYASLRFERNMGKDITVADGVTYSDNGFRNNELWFTDRGSAFIYDFERNDTSPVSPDNLFIADSTAHLANIALFSASNSDQIQYSEIGNFDEIRPLNFLTAESSSDILKRIIVVENDAIAFGEKTIQVFRLTGDPDNPIAPLGNATHQIGCANGRTVSVLTRDFYWVSDDLRVYRSKAQSYNYVPVSLHQGLESDLSKYGADEAFAYSTTHEGHSFYHLVIPKAKRTWVYDEQTSLWHERSSMENCKIRQTSCEDNAYGPHIGLSGVMHEGKAYIGAKGAIYEYDLDYFKDGDQSIMKEATTGIINLSNDGYQIDRVRLDFQNSCKNICDIKNNEVSLYSSDDQARTWCKNGSKKLFSRPDGRVEFRRMGRSSRRSFRWRTFTDEQVVFLRSVMNVTELSYGRR